MSTAGWQVMHSLSKDSSVTSKDLAPGTARRVLSYARPYRRIIAVFLALVVVDAALIVATPLLSRTLDDGITRRTPRSSSDCPSSWPRSPL